MPAQYLSQLAFLANSLNESIKRGRSIERQIKDIQQEQLANNKERNDISREFASQLFARGFRSFEDGLPWGDTIYWAEHSDFTGDIFLQYREG